jgi:hypothetical protein
MKKTKPKFMFEDFKVFMKLFAALALLGFILRFVYNSIAAYYGFQTF